MKKALVIGVLLCLCVASDAQDLSLWTDKPAAEMRNADTRTLNPLRFRTSSLDVDAFQEFLETVPFESSASIRTSGALFITPHPYGGIDTFRLVEYSMMEQRLADRYPHFKTLRGIHVSDPFKTIRCDWTDKGFSAIVNSSEGRYHVEPFARQNQEDYIIFFKRDYPAPTEPFSCGTDAFEYGEGGGNSRVSGDCTFRSYRLAVATTGEYSNYFGAQSDADEAMVLSEVIIVVNRINEVYEKDITVRLILISNTVDVFYYNPGSDPFTGTVCNQRLQCDNTIINVIGNANFDIGHLFGQGSNNGCASLPVICVNGAKGEGATHFSTPTGDPFAIDYVAHEMGHQFGANHTQNNSCNRNNSTALEPGSASTIMGYAGICNPNVQNNSDDYFHGISIQEINNYISNGNGNNCDVPITLNNTAPVVVSGSDYTIPKSTPFRLTATATDTDDDPMTYCWEQWDHEVGSMPPSSTNTVGPMFRSFDPDPSPTRYFPRLSDLVNNINYDWEELPSVGRTMEFRVNVRDFHNGMAGCTDEDNVVITVSAASGPFIVTAPNTSSVEWTEGNTETVTWNVANTTSAPVSCALVDILLSYDGGFTYPEILASGVPNDGSHDVTVPDGVSTTARVMVRGTGNIFFDISNADFEILAGAPTYELTVDPETQTACPPVVLQYLVNVASINGYTDPVLLTTTGAPPGVAVTYAPNPIIPGNTATMTVPVHAGVTTDVYTLMINGNSTSGMKTTSAELVVGVPSVELLLPADGATDVSLAPLMSWDEGSGSDNFNIQIAIDDQFSDIIFDEVTSETEIIPDNLNLTTTYYWRVQGANLCGSGSWTETRVFQTGGCVLLYSTDVPKTIPSSGTPTITSDLVIPIDGSIADVNVIDLEGTHSYLNDLRFTLSSSEGTDVIIINRWCGSQDNFDINLDDEADPGDPPCPYNNGNTYQPENLLSAFVGEDPMGTWVLTINDLANQDGGALNRWALEICLNDGCELVVSNTNNNGPGSLRAALECATPGDTIMFADGLDATSITLLSPLIIQDDVYVLSAPGDGIVIDGSAADRTFDIMPGTSATIEGFTIKAGQNASGSGILNNGALILRDVIVQAGSSSQDQLVVNLGTLTIEGNCEISQ